MPQTCAVRYLTGVPYKFDWHTGRKEFVRKRMKKPPVLIFSRFESTFILRYDNIRKNLCKKIKTINPINTTEDSPP